MSLTEIEKLALATMDMLPKPNLIGGTYEEMREGFKALSDIEKIHYAINLSVTYTGHLEREFKIHSILGNLEDIIGTAESKKIASDIRKNKDGAFKKAGELLAKTSIKDKVVSKRNQKIEDILSKGDKIDL